MTITHRFRRSGNLDFNRAAKAFSYQTHNISSVTPMAMLWRDRVPQTAMPAFRTGEGSSERPEVLDSRDQS
jgi:hypothetical protein